MHFYIITLFPEVIRSYLGSSIIGRAVRSGLVKVKIIDLKKFVSKKKRVDDRQYGGGPGMVMRVDPILRAISSLKISDKKKTLVIFFEPAGETFDDRTALNIRHKYNRLILICGHYEGIDERIKKMLKDNGYKIAEFSMGPYVLTGGELPALIIVDAVSRKIKGVLGRSESLEENRLGIGVPVYTRPETLFYKGKNYGVPKTLLSGHHKEIEEWRRRNKR